MNEFHDARLNNAYMRRHIETQVRKAPDLTAEQRMLAMDIMTEKAESQRSVIGSLK